MMGTWYLGAVDCAWQMGLAHADAVRTIWRYALVASVMAAALCVAVWAAVRMARGRVRGRANAAVLAFLALAAVAWGGTKVVTEEGINLTECRVDSKRVILGWETADERIKPGARFMVQAQREGEWARWETVAETTASNAVIPRFTVDRTHRWRIAVDLGEVQGDEGEGGAE